MQVLNQNITQEKNPTASQQKAEAPVPGMKDGGNTNGIKKAATSGIQGDGISKDKTSKYLKVLTRIEGFLAKDALPEVAVKGFVGAVKKQLNQLTESEKQSLLKLPEARALDLKNLEELPEKIEEKLANADSAKEMMSLLKNPRFASLMKTEESGKLAGTYKPTAMKKPPPGSSAAPSEKKTAAMNPSQVNASPGESTKVPVKVSPG